MQWNGVARRTRPTIHLVRVQSAFVEGLFGDRTDNKATLGVGLRIQPNVTGDFGGSASVESIGGEIKAAMTWEKVSAGGSRCRTISFILP